MTLTPRFRFGNIIGVRSASFPLGRGVSPSVCTVSINSGVRLDRLPHTMSFADGYRSVTFSDCIISDVSPQRGQDGMLSILVSILDRRWRWKYGQMAGSYNIRRAGKIIPSTKKSVRDLLELCFKEIGESRFDISHVPNEVYPFVEWDLERPDAAIDELCKSVNCHVVLRTNDVATVYRDGFGGDLPKLPSSSQGEGYDFGTIPGAVGVVTAPFRWQLDLPLVPVGLDLDGKIKRIDKLSYKPEGGWTNVGDPVELPGVKPPPGRKREVVRKLAEQTVFRWYAIRLPNGLKKMPETKLRIRSVNQLLPVLDNQLDTEEFDRADILLNVENEEGKVRKPAQVYGLFYDETGLDRNSGTRLSRDLKKNPDLLYTKTFTIDNDRALVMFADPIYYLDTDAHRGRGGIYNPPILRLRTAVNFHHEKTRAAYRLEKRINLFRQGGASVDWQPHEDVVPEWKRESSGENGGNAVTNLKEVSKQLDYYLQYAAERYQTRNPASGTYPILLPVSPDGRIAQVIFEIDSEGFIGTSVHKEIEGLTSIVPYEERRRQLAQIAGQRRLRKQFNRQDESKRGKT